MVHFHPNFSGENPNSSQALPTPSALQASLTFLLPFLSHISLSTLPPQGQDSVNQYSATILKALFHLLCQNKFSQTLLPGIIKGYAMPVSVATLGMALDSISLLESEL